MKIVAMSIIALTLNGCAIIQGQIDQAAARQEAAPALAGEFVLPLAGFGTPELSESLQRIGKGIARRARPWSQIEITIATRDEERLVVGEIERGIRSTGWTPEALTYPHIIRIDPYAAPAVRVVDGLPAISNIQRAEMIKKSREAKQLM